MQFSSLLKYIDYVKVYNLNSKKIFFNFVSTNSNSIKKNSILVINKKKKFKKKYIFNAIDKGVVGLITNYYYRDIKLPQILVKDIDISLKKILFKLKENSPKNTVGITGTNGKTTVVWYISKLLYHSNRNVKSYGTLGYYKDLEKKESSLLTTPEYEVLHQNAYSKLENKFDFIFEVSSHSIVKKRIKDFKINIAAITNISHDHLDFHRNFASYRSAKFKLFTNYLDKNGIAIINDSIKGISSLKKQLIKKNVKVISYGLLKSNVYFKQNKRKSFLKVFDKNYKVKLKDYNLYDINNLLCSISCCVAMGIKINKILKAIPLLDRPIGRMQEAGILSNGSKVLIDYAHTPDALKNILTVNIIRNKKPNLLFGCGGERDKNKRKLMGRIANKFANRVYVTDDNPRNENPSKIRKSIISQCAKAIEISNRKEAIKKSIKELTENEILIIAGKGHENKQYIKNKILNFDDSKIAKFYINKINKL